MIGARTIAQLLLATSVAAGVATPLGGRGTPVAPPELIHQADAYSPYDDGLFLSDGPIPLLTNRTHSTSNSDWLRFETDSCGLPERTESKRSIVTRSAFDDDMDDEEDMDPVDQAWDMVGKWLSPHSEIAVVTDGVAKSCDDYSFGGDDVAPDSIARWPARPVLRNARSPWLAPGETSYIA